MNSQHNVRLSKVLLMLCLSAAIVMGTMPCAPFVTTARADETEKTIICLGADVLSVNCADVGAATVYYGKHHYYGELAWRVINYDGEGALFNGKENNLTLFAGGSIGYSCFSERIDKNNKYGNSKLKTKIDNIYSADFTEKEKGAIKKRELYSGNCDGLNTDCISGNSLTGEDAPYLWPLSAKEANAIKTNVGNKADNYLKADNDWWLRSPGPKILSGMNVSMDGEIRVDGDGVMDVRDNDYGVRPAFNIGLPSVISTSLISGTKGNPGAEYKLTILDSDLSVLINSISKSGDDKITLSYTITDNSSIDPTQLSVLITDGDTTWTENGWSCSQVEGKISYRQYTKLDVNNFSLSGTGTFTLDPAITGTLGEDYHVYILAEDVNGEHETDYASTPMEILDIAEEDKPDEPEREASKPVLIKATSDAISVEVEEGVEYSIDGGNNWKTTGIFTGLQSDTEYSVIARYKAGGGKEAGKPSEALTVRTLKIVVTPVSTKTLSVSGNEIKVETFLSSEENKDGKGYSVGQVEIPDDVALSLFNSLTEEEQKRVANGAKLTITVSVKESVIYMEDEGIKNNKKNADEKIKEISGGTVEATGVMLDMGLFVQVGTDEKKETEPSKGSGKISFTVTVPVEMKNTDGSVTRTYYLVHIHDDGTVEIVSSGTDTELPAETDSFSYWYLTYVDEKKDDGGNSGNPSGEKVTTVSDNQPMAYSEETKGEFRIGYFHEIPFFGKAKPELKLFGDIKVIYDGKEYKATKIKVNKKKCLIRITGLDNADKDTVKAVKKATKGTNGLSFKVNPYYVKDTDTVTPKFKKDGSLKSVKVKINEKDYKAKKDEFTYDETSKTVSFSGKNLNGSCKLD